MKWGVWEQDPPHVAPAHEDGSAIFPHIIDLACVCEPNEKDGIIVHKRLDN